MTIKIPPGVFDIIPNDPKEKWKSSYLWQYLETVIHETAKDYGYQEIRTPIFERTELFQRSVGEDTDIVSKEMYTFIDKGDRSLSLRPEGTASVMRAIIDHQMCQGTPVQKLYYICPMFRYERSQAGRYRQHHQFGAEAIGNDSPEQDVELIDLIYTVYIKLGLENLSLSINSIGDQKSRSAFRDALKIYLKDHFHSLSEDSKRRFETNPLRILDSKAKEDQPIIANSPSILDFLSSDEKDHFEEVKKLLQLLNIPYEVNHNLVRGLDYYNKTVFEITAGELGAQNSLVGGGRYDGLLKLLGGPDLPAIGFGCGLERVIQTLLKQNVPIPETYKPMLFMIPLGDHAKKVCFKIIKDLRQSKIPVQMDFTGRKLGKVMQYADQIQAQYVVVLGEDEIKSGRIKLKEMSTGDSYEIPIDNLPHLLRVQLKSEDFMNIWEEMNQPIKDPSEAEFFSKHLENSIENTQKLSKELQKAMEKMKEIL